jgi:thiol-disulfide isomerase/thioredoxin
MKTCIYALTLTLLAPLAVAKEKEAKPALPDKSLADVRWGTLVNEAAFNKDDLAGKVVVVEEWGVKCPPCIASLPDLAKMGKSGEKKGLVVIGFECQNSSKEDILKVLKSARVEYPVMTGASAPGGTGGIPHVCVFDVTGKLVFNGNPHDGDFEKAVKKALRDVKEK